ncbi:MULTISPECIES: phosphatase PAP2 family protein [Pseudoalteromonas]|jgi:undecaprenyl-diphosphatase|uniref:undecaprenyl-diphosphate phosphatase n=1 Tax=Pseudoalteromonas lipolytica TaxID=570156 RepID=A0A0P7D5K9_9GAMM|nr:MULTISPECIES: phosphatase PAP2 family protein [Pseudoalteromonas]MED5512647.1 phosphatase PAP2 family protein [Pseudomonadota bacterium]KPM83907.1 phosphoesterase [Pseudoalteromonas lipolytica]MCF2849608.1 phosphatase PAP2 family protein [Pseudoalteromonas sp. PAST1]MCF2917498.1 phosphatase PAP2 family protein [Pseudoalteromonas sp. Cn5-37]MCH2087245.1 phosphatase PAP2 family protein [Pseudoalteromonas sp.]|tara:strand:+ start:155 stop:691 length:537 start_codon:yes stop_codon:yes gene_type:complete
MANNILTKLAKVDEQLFLSVFNDASPVWLRRSAIGFSKSGDGGLYVALFLSFWWFTEQAHFQQLAMSLLVGFVIERPIYFLVKKRIARVRPCDCLVQGAYLVPSDRFSLPSGHSAGAFVVATILTMYLPEFAGLWLVWASGVAASRVIIGVHYPADVVIGAVMGSSCAVLAVMVVESI